MKNLEDFLATIASTNDCVVAKRLSPLPLQIEYSLPTDLQYYLENYSSIKLFKSAEYPLEIVGAEDFLRANPVIIGEEIEDDISNNWFIIATDGKSQYITIDLSKERLGKCYDSFWDRHGVAGEQPVIANSFTELLQNLYKNTGNYPYWLEEGFQSLGDAYDNT
ncbi:SMI1/KNR4 family protein [Hymenobacter sediminis]|uniref:SMI1/KNR4 family protein n=1 Tax=Hymenobacter sediminis TaxID=2218621 RepID=UPI000DA66F02|nr:SMI1/KNR4 family protein [Hymenobacter sediminis]RPD43598.1 SMI1/KNR4 family protein [Hymenobacter sediminis]